MRKNFPSEVIEDGLFCEQTLWRKAKLAGTGERTEKGSAVSQSFLQLLQPLVYSVAHKYWFGGSPFWLLRWQNHLQMASE